MPALFISTCTAPNASYAASRSRSTSSMRLTSVRTAITSDDSAATSARAASSRSLTSARHTFMPSPAKRFAAASPMPLAPPVMTATLPAAIAG